MRMNRQRAQIGVSLIEVLISLLILGIGILGAAALQLNALKYTDSSTMNSQASFIAYDMMDRMRANPDVSYALGSIASAPTAGDLDTPRTQDLFDFAFNIRDMGGTDGSIVVNGRVVTITVTWDDSRAGAARTANQTTSGQAALQTFTLTSRVAGDAVTP
ncbi:type IV pilus modification protein PilV [Pseudomonas rhizosphaerae]|jgi:type IV pilus assembly protein PilV|uniref:type IV pilus modification protein PilV n=1 Tax=Pseudomonas rhizosphaerae TaxID=216142 RepID=UPI0017812511|nr:type IV pilus modification protein PilV [Pseudomonas rhizosphaerae]MBD8616400.1 type IV pilus modification protein PilV [Pseudomonas putida]MEB2871812.1 type IV pilus modification protein PilV [Pseudomonas rhizosphaerae]